MKFVRWDNYFFKENIICILLRHPVRDQYNAVDVDVDVDLDWLSLFLGVPRTASVGAWENCKYYHFPPHYFCNHIRDTILFVTILNQVGAGNYNDAEYEVEESEGEE